MQGPRRKSLDLMMLTRSISELTTPYMEKDDLAPFKNALESNMQGVAVLATTKHKIQPFLDLQTSGPPMNGFQPQGLPACSVQQEPVDHKWSHPTWDFHAHLQPVAFGPFRASHCSAARQLEG